MPCRQCCPYEWNIRTGTWKYYSIFHFPLKCMVSVRMKAADFCLDFLPFTKGSMEPDTGINIDQKAPERAEELRSCFKINSLLTSYTS